MNWVIKLIAISFACLLNPPMSHAAVPVHLDMIFGDGVTDTSGAFNAAVDQVCASDETRTLRIPMGRFRFTGSIDPIPCAINIVGEGMAVTTLIRDNRDGEFLVVVGGQDEYGGGSIRDLKIATDPNRHSGIALTIRASLETDPTVGSKNPHGFLIDNIAIGRDDAFGGTWNYGIYLDGSLNASPPPGIAWGIRWVRIRNSSVSVAQILPYLFYHAPGTQTIMGDCWISPNPTIYFLNSPSSYTLTNSCLVQYVN